LFRVDRLAVSSAAPFVVDPGITCLGCKRVPSGEAIGFLFFPPTICCTLFPNYQLSGEFEVRGLCDGEIILDEILTSTAGRHPPTGEEDYG